MTEYSEGSTSRVGRSLAENDRDHSAKESTNRDNHVMRARSDDKGLSSH